MANTIDKINQLRYQLEMLSKKQEGFAVEIKALRQALNDLYAAEKNPSLQQTEVFDTQIVAPITEAEIGAATTPPIATPPAPRPKPYQPPASETGFFGIERADLERFIGENLINKIGILILVIGVFIGVKYSIEHDLVSPLTRIIFAYLMAIGLLGFGIKLKEKYENYSSVLVGGAMAMLYFVTFIAYSFYGLMPQGLAFAMMVLFTAFTVVAAMQYNRQIIAHIGLVGAYCVPFLLSNGSGNVTALFSYMTIINLGILFIAFKRDWKPLYYVTFGITWFIFGAFMMDEYKMSQHFYIALTFASIFFVSFYTMFLAYKMAQKEDFKEGDSIVLITNSFIFYGIGYGILSEDRLGSQLLGLFTLLNAVVHFAVSALIYQRKIADRNVFYLVSGLVLVFITIAVPVQLDGNFVTLLWAGEAALLFWIGRTKAVKIYENISIPLMFLALFSLIIDWGLFNSAIDPKHFLPIFNTNFLTNLLFFGAFGFIFYTHLKNPPTEENKGIFGDFLYYFTPAILLLVSYVAFFTDINIYFSNLYANSMLTLKTSGAEYGQTIWHDDLLSFENIWIMNYSIVFVMILAFLNIKKIKNYPFGYFTLFLLVFSAFIFLTFGFMNFNTLRESYLSQHNAKYYNITSYNIAIRYISYLFLGGALFTVFKYVKDSCLQPELFPLRKTVEIILGIVVLCVLSSELINALTFVQASQSDKLGLSVFWGVYALVLIALGIWKRKKHLRIAAIALFAVTLLKLFLYDIAQLETIAKTIVFVSLGILLLVISFLYNKYKHLIEEEVV